MLESWTMMEQKKEVEMKNKNNFSLYFFQIGFLLLILVMFIPGVLQASGMLFTEEESRVWGYTYTLFGIDWSYYVSEDTLYSFGYSLLVAPLIAILRESPAAVYKIAVLGNGIFLTLSYVISLYVMYKLFPKRNKIILTVACVLAALIPGYASVKYLAVPDMAIVLLIWIQLAVLIQIKKKGKKNKIYLLSILAGIGGSFHAGMIIVAMIEGVLLLKLAKRRKVKREDALIGILIMAALIFITQIVENLWLSAITVGAVDSVSTSLETLIKGIRASLNQIRILEVLGSFFNRIYGLGVGTWVLAFPGIAWVIRRGDNCSEVEQAATYMPVAMGVIMGLYGAGSTELGAALDARCLITVAGPITAIGFIYLTEATRWKEMLAGSISALFLLTFQVSSQLKSFDSSVDTVYYSSLLSNLLEKCEIQSYKPYVVTVVVACTLLLFCLLIRADWKNKRIKRCFQGGACSAMVIGLLILNAKIMQVDVLNVEKEAKNIYEKILAMLHDNTEDIAIYYLKEGKDQDQDIARLQYRMGMNQLLPANLSSESKNKKEKNNLDSYYKDRNSNGDYYAVIASNSVRMRQFEEQYRMLETTDGFYVFTGKNSKAEQIAENTMAENIYEWNREKINLTPGTYECTISYQVNRKGENGLGVASVLASGEVLNSAELSEDGKLARITFTSDRVLKNVSFQIACAKGADVTIDSVIYRKSSTKYSVGINNEEQSRQVLNVMKEIDQLAEEKGELKVIVDDVIGDQYNSVVCVQNILPGYQISSLKRGDKTQSEYLMSDMTSRGFYDYLDQYTIVAKNDTYVLMLKNDSDKFEYVKAAGGSVLSDGRKLDVRGFLKKNNGEYESNAPISLPSGCYSYAVKLTCTEELMREQGVQIAKVALVNKGTIIAEETVRYEDFNEQGEALIKVPLSTSSDLKSLTFEIQEEKIDLEGVPAFIEMTADRYQLGSDEPDSIEALMETTGKISQSGDIYFVTTTRIYDNERFSLDSLQTKYSGYTFKQTIQSRVKYMKSDCFLIVWDFDSRYMGLTENYTMVEKKGRYSLWVASYGRMKANAIDRGVSMWTNEGKIPVEVFQDEDTQGNELGKFKKGKYQLNIVVQKDDDSVEKGTLQLIARKDESLIEKEIEAKFDEMLLKGEVKPEDRKDERIRNIVRESLITENMVALHEVSSGVFQDGNQMVVTMNFTLEYDVEKLILNCYSYDGGNMTGIMQWIEKTS